MFINTEGFSKGSSILTPGFPSVFPLYSNPSWVGFHIVTAGFNIHQPKQLSDFHPKTIQALEHWIPAKMGLDM